jgi:hypothetical protein
MILEKPVKFLVVKNLSCIDGLKNIETTKNLTRKNRNPVSYKITKQQVKTALELLKRKPSTRKRKLKIINNILKIY